MSHQQDWRVLLTPTFILVSSKHSSRWYFCPCWPRPLPNLASSHWPMLYELLKMLEWLLIFALGETWQFLATDILWVESSILLDTLQCTRWPSQKLPYPKWQEYWAELPRPRKKVTRYSRLSRSMKQLAFVVRILLLTSGPDPQPLLSSTMDMVVTPQVLPWFSFTLVLFCCFIHFTFIIPYYIPDPLSVMCPGI